MITDNELEVGSNYLHLIHNCIKDYDFEMGVYLFGAGPHGRAAKKYLNENGIIVVNYLDNDKKKQGKNIDGIEVISLESISNNPQTLILITARHSVISVKRQLDEKNLYSLSFDAYFVYKNIDSIKKLRNIFLHDDISLLSLDAIIETMLTGNKSYLINVINDKQYFALPEFINIGNDYFVDAGAYVGDSIEKFIWANNGVFNQIYAFEPGNSQRLSASIRIKRLCAEWAIDNTKITLVSSGLSDRDGDVEICLSPDMLQTTSVGCIPFDSSVHCDKVNVCSLDTYLDGRPATFIKADIEGSEMAMLRGAKNTIQLYKPKMALSIYHEPTDLYKIAEYVHELVPEYSLALRHHSPTLMETVLYCWIAEI